MPILLLAAAGLAAVFVVKQVQAAAPAPTAPKPAIAPPVTTSDTSGVGAVIGIFVDIFEAVGNVGTNVQVWEAEAKRYLKEGYADDKIIADMGVRSFSSTRRRIMKDIVSVVGPDPSQWYTSQAGPYVITAIEKRIRRVRDREKARIAAG